MSKILGLDLGTNSIGWAFIDSESKKIIGTGVRIFPEGLNRTPSGSEESKNAQRRTARGMRRRLDRYQMRRSTLQEYLKKQSFYPKEKVEEDLFFKMDPYEIRKKGLDEKLSLYEIGRSIFHINQRRGFKSNRKTAGKDDNKIFKGYSEITGITETEQAIKEGGFRTLGEYLSTLKPEEQRRRNRFALRKMYEEEVDALWEKQRSFYPDELTDDIKNHIKDIVFFQRKLKSQKENVAFCTFESQKRCAPKSSPVYQYFRILETIVRIRITTDDRFDEALGDEERFLLIEKLNKTDRLEIEKIKKILHLPQDTHINLEDQLKIYGNRTYSALSRVFGTKRWDTFSDEKKHEIWHTLHFSDDDLWLEEYARKKWLLNDNEIKKLLIMPLESGYARLSAKAMKNIIPHLEEGLTYDQACLEAGYHHSDIYRPDHLADELPEPENIRNPLVQQSLYELRKLVNTIGDTYGKPEIVRVELLRDLKLSKDKRQQIFIENKRKEKHINEVKEILRNELHFPKITSDAIQKYLLWEESKRRCPYTGKDISLAGLFNGEFEIEHIIPYSRSLDNSMANKTLCHRSVNQEKGNLTPYEAFGNDPQRWFEITTCVKRDMPHKLRKFLMKDVGKEINEDFFNHQYTDSAYISREVSKYLKLICPKVQVTKGGATAQLRQMWGLNTILSVENENKKNREDQRHHAIDALVIANVNPGVLHRLSKCHKYSSEPEQEQFPEPWDNFRNDASDNMDRVLISYKVNPRVRGKLHEETYYGKIRTLEGKETYVVRKPVKSLTAKEIGNIVDPVVRQAVYDRLKSLGVNTDTKLKDIPKEAFVNPLYMPNGKTKIKKVRVIKDSETMYPLYSDNDKLFVQTGSNHHIEIFRHKQGGKGYGRVVRLIDAVKNEKEKLPVIDKTPPNDDYEFAYSLAINEMAIINPCPEIEIQLKEKNYGLITQRLYRVKKIDSLSEVITFIHHLASGKNEVTEKKTIFWATPSTLNAIKVVIDPVGNIYPVND
ncbi:MAG: type II CRISPR RNA-guided endonuclease Cas9 [archaeon]